MRTREHAHPRLTPGRHLAALLLVLPLAGCVANSSNPTVMVRSASSDDQHASFDLDLSNPGGRDLTATRLDYSVSHGESGFPAAKGSWSGKVDLPAKGHAMLTLDTRFEEPPMEPDSHLLHLTGELFFVDRTGYLGISTMDLTRTSFHADVEANRSKP
jgi:hypothetical protein